jgi:hypothetical protein
MMDYKSFYHGTHQLNCEPILRYGILLSIYSEDYYYSGVCLSTSRTYAMTWGERTLSPKKRFKPIVIEVRIPKKYFRFLTPDYNQSERTAYYDNTYFPYTLEREWDDRYVYDIIFNPYKKGHKLWEEWCKNYRNNDKSLLGISLGKAEMLIQKDTTQRVIIPNEWVYRIHFKDHHYPDKNIDYNLNHNLKGFDERDQIVLRGGKFFSKTYLIRKKSYKMGKEI